MDDTTNKINCFVKIENLYSCENYIVEQDKTTPVLKDINFEVNPGDLWGVGAVSPFEAGLLAEIIANVKPYYSGKCTLINMGMMKTKRIILPHLFLINTHEMLYDNMNVLEYLMFATLKVNKNYIDRQTKIFNLLLKLGLSYISLSNISVLTSEEKIIIELIVAVYSNSEIIILNVINYTFSDELISIIKKIFTSIKDMGNSIIIATAQAKIIGICCDHALYLVNGSVKFAGPVIELNKFADKVRFVITNSDTKSILKKLETNIKEFTYGQLGNNIFVYDNQEEKLNDNYFFQKLAEHDIMPDLVKINRGRVQNSFEELMNNNDL